MCVSVLSNLFYLFYPSCSVARGTFQDPVGVHYVMFIPTLKSLGTVEQAKKWIPLAESFRVLGTYAQTELGHGQSHLPQKTTSFSLKVFGF